MRLTNKALMLGLAARPTVKPAFCRVRSTHVIRSQMVQTRLAPTQVSVDQLYNNWKDKYMGSVGDGRKYIKYNLAGDSQPADAVTTSESIGYGMLISVLRGERDDFDGLLKFYQSFINPTYGLMKWQIKDNFTALNDDSATDGDMDAAYALFKAEQLWGGGAYKTQGLNICDGLLKHCIKSGDSHMPMLGSWAGPDPKRVLSRSSDWMPTHFALFEKEDSANASQWKATFERTVAAYQRNLSQHPTGLLADFYVYDEGQKVYNPAPGYVLEDNQPDSHDKDYYTNACRVPWRLAAYWNAEGEQAVNDAGLRPAMEALKTFFENEVQSKGEVKGAYRLNGDAINSWTNNNYVGPAWRLLKVMGSSHADALEPVVQQHLYDRYYADSILLMAVLETM